MKDETKKRLETLLVQVKGVCESTLQNLFTLGKEVNTKSIISYTYSPQTDIVYVYCKDSISGNLLYRELQKIFSSENGIDTKSIKTDVVNNMFIIEIEFGDKNMIALNLKENAETKSIDNRYL